MKNEELWDPTLHPVSLRLGHTADLTVHRTVIQYRGAAALPVNREGRKMRSRNLVFKILKNKSTKNLFNTLCQRCANLRLRF